MHVLNFTLKYKQVKLCFAINTDLLQKPSAGSNMYGQYDVISTPLIERKRNSKRSVVQNIERDLSIVRYHRFVINESALANRMDSFQSTKNRPLFDD